MLKQVPPNPAEVLASLGKFSEHLDVLDLEKIHEFCNGLDSIFEAGKFEIAEIFALVRLIFQDKIH